MVMTTADTSDVRDVIQALPNFLLFAHHVHCVARLTSLNRSRPVVQLSGREREILRWAAVGKTSWEIGRILNLAESTINFHLRAAARKLNVAGRLATCAQALTLGLIVL
jgi:LuxR family transcriptional activator of bioluminescence operon